LGAPYESWCYPHSNFKQLSITNNLGLGAFPYLGKKQQFHQKGVAACWAIAVAQYNVAMWKNSRHLGTGKVQEAIRAVASPKNQQRQKQESAMAKQSYPA
jgi:hypothetical protein